MRKVAVLLGMLALLVAVPAQATVMYTFTGTEFFVGTPTLAGTLFFDDSTPFVLFPHDFGPPLGTLLSATLPPSPLSTIAGTFNGIAFIGFATLQISNLPLFSDTPIGQWIVRSNIASPDGSLVHLNLFISTGPGGIVPISLIPPTPCCVASSGAFPNSQYAIVFADGTSAAGALSLTVPEEVPTGLLVALAGTLLAFVMRSSQAATRALLMSKPTGWRAPSPRRHLRSRPCIEPAVAET